MSLASGTRLGSYEIVARLGAGGMGEVYRARDHELGREVAIKVLPAEMGSDPDRLARFRREAEVLASLNHPHIAQIHGLADGGGVRGLVLELIEGDTLADRLMTGPLPPTEALTLASQVADALEAAHEKGIVHRDLKPANIAVTTGGQVKVLDFGIAKAIESYRSADLSNRQTLADTQAGVTLGTPAYMSPEQTRGLAVDKRGDIWAFGCVLYETLTGHRAFSAETVSDTVASILTREPDWRALPLSMPARVQWLLRRCLEKDPKRRLHDIADARIEIDEVLRDLPASGDLSVAGQSVRLRSDTLRERAAWIAAGVSVLALIAIVVFGRGGSTRSVTGDARSYRSSILLPEGVRLPPGSPAGRFALSPDGRRLAFLAADATGRIMLWVRALDTTVSQPLAGTDGAAFPFWSPDSRFLAFQSQGKLKKVDASGGPTTTLCDATSNASGAWNHDDVILFTPRGGTGLYRVSALGGTPTAATSLDEVSGEAQHWFPFFLPDDRHFLYFALGSKTGGAIDPRGIYVGSLDPNEPAKMLLPGGSNAKYADGHLIFMRGRTLMAQPFDLERLEFSGDAVSLAEQVQIPGAGDTGTAGAFSVAETGALVYQTGLDVVRSQLTWFDRGGRQVGLLGDQADYSDVALSADGKRAAVSVLDPARSTRDLWMYDVARGLRTRFTSDPADEIAPVWSPDLSRVMFASGRKGGFDIYEKLLSGATGDDLVLEKSLGEFPESVSSDGRFLLYVFGSGMLRRSDLWVLPLFGDRKPVPFMATSFTETQAQFSPDGRWVAYTSNESGQFEVYVAPFPGPGNSFRVSPAGGSWPKWRRDGSEIIFLATDSMLTSATVTSRGADFAVGAIRPLFAVRPRPQVRLDAFLYDVSADGQRFLVNSFVEETASTAITLMVNWTAALAR